MLASHLFAIVMVMDEASKVRYAANIATVKCYADAFGCTLFVQPVNSVCANDIPEFMLQRHCHLRMLMERKREIEWWLFIDGDVAVVNGQGHRLQDYIDSSKDVIHGLRFHNNEVMAGYYFIRNTEYGRGYLREWEQLHAGTRHVHRYSLANADNGALHYLLFRRLIPTSTLGYYTCLRKGQVAGTYGEFVTCFHHMVHKVNCTGTSHWDHIKIVSRERHVAYDAWVTYYRWSNNTFMHHAMKNPPIESASCCTRPLIGRRLPATSITCDTLTASHRDYYVTPAVLSELMAETRAFEKRKHIPLSWISTSCIQ